MGEQSGESKEEEMMDERTGESEIEELLILTGFFSVI